MGGRIASPFAPCPFSRISSPSLSVYAAKPASGGASCAQLWSGCTGTIHTGPPCNARELSRLPRASRGVWHSVHLATSSVKYFPRLICAWFGEAVFDGACFEVWVRAITAPANRISAITDELKVVLI